MNQIQYKLSVLPLFEEDLNGIVDYITEQLNNPTAALNLVDDIESAIKERLEAPVAFAPYQSSKKRIHPYYRINVKKYSVFYVVIGDILEVRRVLYSGRDIDRLLV